MRFHNRYLIALSGLGLATAPAVAQNLLQNGSFETSPPILFWQGPIDFNRGEHKPVGPTPDGVNYGSNQSGGPNVSRLTNHQPVALSNVGARTVTLTGSWGAGITCAGPNTGNPCSNLVKCTAIMRVFDGNTSGTEVARKEQEIDAGIGEDLAIPSGFGWSEFSISGSASSGQATVQFGWINGPTAWSDGIAVHADKLDLRETTSTPLHLSSAVSERTHGVAGPNGMDAPLSGTVLVEPRQNGATPRMLLSFDGAPAATDGTINCGQEVTVTNGTCNSVSVSGNVLTVNMTFNKNAGVTVALSGLTGLTGDNNVCVRTVEGDVDQSNAVNVSDLQQIKNSLLTSVDILNFLKDVTADGSINLADLQATKNNLLVTALSCP